jgi:GT2 family glycosyltransferase/glycosyltransferase involved in cell wall biosynthesis
VRRPIRPLNASIDDDRSAELQQDQGASAAAVAVTTGAAPHDAAPGAAPLPIGVVQGPFGGDALLMLARATAPDAVEFRVGRESFLASIGEEMQDDPLLHVNQVVDGEFAAGVRLWKPTRLPQGWVIGQDHRGWTLKGSHTAFIRQDAPKVPAAMELLYDTGTPDGLIPLRPGALYQFSGLLAAHRCRGEIVVRLLDEAGEEIGEFAAAPTPDAVGGESPGGYDRVTVNVAAPARPCAAQLLLRKGETEHGDDSWFFFAQLSFARLRERIALPFAPCPLPAEEVAVLQRLDVEGVRVFRVPLPTRQTRVEVIERASGTPLAGSPLVVEQYVQAVGAITGLEGSTVVGWARDANKPSMPIRVRLFVDGKEAGDAMADQPSGESRQGFRLPLPSSVLDGQVHRLAVRLRNDQLVAETAEILPALLTPWSALARYGSVKLPARLSTAAGYRYEALRAQLEALSRDIAAGEGPARDTALAILPQLAAAHERVLAGIDRKVKLGPLAFPVHAHPRVSVVIPVHNKFAVTHNCLAALLLAYNQASFEVIVADDGSSDETTEIEELVSGIVYCRNETAEGFVSACNLGASRARGDYVVLLNNDTEPTARWLDEMLHVFDNFDRVGMVGSKLIYPDGRLQEAGGIIWGDGSAWNYGRLGNPADPKFCYTRQADYLSGASLMMPRPLWEQLGGLSAEFRPAYYEDTDLAFKVRDAGYRTVYAPLSVVFHFEGISNGTSTSSGLKRFQEVNRPKFLRKWRSAYRHNGTDTAKADLEKDRGIGLRALFIDAQPPRPDQDAGSHAAVQEMRAMQALGAKVTFLPENLAFLGEYTTNLQRAGIEAIYAPFANSVEDFLERRGKEFDVVYITRYMVADRHIEAVRRLAPQARIMFCNADLHFLRELREAIRAKDQGKLEGAIRTRDTELRVMRSVDVTLSYNPVEHAVILSHNLDSTRVTTAPWIVDTAAEVPRFGARSDIAFLGGFGHPPNAEAVEFFLREVMPLLRPRVPGIRFLVYGSAVPKEIEALAAEDVLIKGFVEDVAEVFTTCRVFVAPLLSGAGLKGKVVDALSFGVPSVLSPIAAEGVGLSEGAEAMVARTPAEWVEAIAALHEDEARWARMSDAALSFARRTYSLERGIENMRAAVEMAGLVPDEGMVVKRARLGL